MVENATPEAVGSAAQFSSGFLALVSPITFPFIPGRPPCLTPSILVSVFCQKEVISEAIELITVPQ
jgi:hypothetical protein